MPAWLTAPQISLAPMEGVTDALLRDFLTSAAADSPPFDAVFTEFIRVSEEPIPVRAFRKHIPELAHECRTPSGTPLIVQLLGGDPARVALSARNAVEAGARAIDLNFGCPARTVNRNDGGATLLLHPQRLKSIVRQTRDALSPDVSVSVKMRLGWDAAHAQTAVYENAELAQEAGASWITIHARTRMQAYAPPVDWRPIRALRQSLRVPVIANGDIWGVDSHRACQSVAGLGPVMLGRSALADPHLPKRIANPTSATLDWQSPLDWLQLWQKFASHLDPQHKSPGYPHKRIKQWCAFLEKRLGPQPWIALVRRTQTLSEVWSVLVKAEQEVWSAQESPPLAEHVS